MLIKIHGERKLIRTISKMFLKVNWILFLFGGTFSFAQEYFPVVFNISARAIPDVLVVDKSKQTLFVLQSTDSNSVSTIQEFRITTGRNDGAKQKAGDLKTPEGIYKIISKISGNNLPEIYGPFAFVLNYPNFADKVFHHNGLNIWIHGRNEKIVDKQTEGCISMENGHLIDLAKFITISKTPVIIFDNLVKTTAKQYDESSRMWNDYFNRWLITWSEGDTATYFNFYSPLFRDNVYQNLNQFKIHKKRIEELYKWKDVAAHDLYILSSKIETHICFTQEYLCPNFYSKGVKTLILIPDRSAWKIVGEDLTSIIPGIAPKKFIADFLNSWKTSWESKDIDQFIAFYDSSFHGNNLSYSRWREYKKGIFDRTKKIRLDVASLDVTTTEKMVWTVTFKQHYSADNYSDVGFKKMLIRGRPGNLKILSEEWSAVK